VGTRARSLVAVWRASRLEVPFAPVYEVISYIHGNTVRPPRPSRNGVAYAKQVQKLRNGSPPRDKAPRWITLKAKKRSSASPRLRRRPHSLRSRFRRESLRSLKSRKVAGAGAVKPSGPLPPTYCLRGEPPDQKRLTDLLATLRTSAEKRRLHKPRSAVRIDGHGDTQALARVEQRR
jgi:hypothetical protein